MAELTHPIQEAERYLSNARNILSEKAEKNGDYYNDRDRKHIKKAGNTAWDGVSLALDAVFGIKRNKKKWVNIKDYQSAMAEKDPKMTKPLYSTYATLCLALGCDGTLSCNIVQIGFEQAEEMINWAAKQYKQAS